MKISLNPLKIVLITASLLMSLVASAQDEMAHLVLVNKDLPMVFIKPSGDKIMVNPAASQFVVETGQTVEIDLKSSASADETYLRGESLASPMDQSVFFGIKAAHGQAIIYGFTDQNIAYSYVPNVVVFCSPQYYQKHDGCLN